MPKIDIDPKYPVIGLSTRERQIMRWVKPVLDRMPNNDAEKDLIGDAFAYLYKTNPQLVDEPQEDRRVNHAVMSWLDSGKPNRESTISSMTAATVAAGVLWSGLTEDATIKKALDKQKEAEDAADEAREAEQQLADLATKSGGNPSQQQKDQMRKLAAKANNARQMAAALAEEGVKEIEEAKGHKLKKYAAKRVMDKAEKAGEEVEAFMAGWGVEEGELQYSDVEKIAEYVKDADVSEITKLFGRLRGECRKTIKGVRASKVGGIPKVMDTKDFHRIFADEIAMMGEEVPEVVRLQQISRFVQRGLRGFQPLADQKTSGSFLMYNDWSGSVDEGVAHAMNSLAIAIGRAVQDEIEPNRVFELYGFDSRLQASATSKDDWRNLLHWATQYSGGGTNIMLVLRHAIDRIMALKDAGIGNCDITIITDGQAHMDPEVFARLNQVKAEVGTRLCYIHIGWGVNETLKDESDLFIHVDNPLEFKESVEQIAVQVSTLIANH